MALSEFKGNFNYRPDLFVSPFACEPWELLRLIFDAAWGGKLRKLPSMEAILQSFKAAASAEGLENFMPRRARRTAEEAFLIGLLTSQSCKCTAAKTGQPRDAPLRRATCMLKTRQSTPNEHTLHYSYEILNWWTSNWVDYVERAAMGMAKIFRQFFRK
jgi:hypothetical protein